MNMHPKEISIADYRYDLPSAFIAHYPLTERDASRLLIYRDGEIGEDVYRNIGTRLPEHSLLVFNNTKVVEARIIFHKPTGSKIEIFCLEPPPEYGDIVTAMMQTGKVRWKCLVGGASKWKAGQVLVRSVRCAVPGNGAEGPDVEQTNEMEPGPIAAGQDVHLEVRYIDKLEDAFLLEFSWTPAGLTFAELLHEAGLIPLPPYIRRAAEPSDTQRYQTIYARHDGSVAAPTAGLHFTEAIFDSLAGKDIRRTFVTLHVGAGTFLPVKTATMEQHAMHIEFIAVTRDTIGELLGALRTGRPVIPVGTTSARTIESLYWLGVKALRDPGIAAEDLVVRQWDAYEGSEGGGRGDECMGDGEVQRAGGGRGGERVGSRRALEALLDWMERGSLPQLVTTTQLLITPGYEWKIAGALITNFHQPESTLLLLVASLIGKDWRRVYAHALEHGFRFLSYGDGCLLFPARGDERG
jgi:S-adenosylmethionine:tRNA ribosyltransferase-isomerase